MVKVSNDHRYVLYALWIGVAVYFVGLIVTIAGVSALQYSANTLSFVGAPPELLQAYKDLYAQGSMPPYPYDPDYQLAFFWFLGVLELVIFLSLVGTVFNQYRLHRGRFILLTFLASAQAIVYKVIDQLLFFSRQEAPKQLYGASRLYTALAGAIILSIGNGVTVIGLGLVEPVVEAPASQAGSDTGKGNSVDTV